jgi:hypothetical protein
MSECEGITELYKGKFVQVYLVDETIELSVANNVYSRSESLELLEELKIACASSEAAKRAQDEYLSHYPNHLPRLMENLDE